MGRICVYLTNLGKYVEGCLMGEWVQLPVPDDKLQEVLDRIGINDEYEEYFITDSESELSNMEISQYASLSSLNELAERIEELADYDYEKLAAILEWESHLSVTEILDIIEDLDSFDLLTEVEDDEGLGYYFSEVCSTFDTVPDNLRCYIDMERFGRDLRLELNCCYTSYGAIIDNR